MKAVSIFLCMSLATLFSGCVLKYEDVSKEPEYSPLLNTSYSLSTNMLIYGVNLPPGYGKDINVYIITPDIPGMTGREIITKDRLSSGTTLRIQGVRRSTNHLAGRQKMQVEVGLAPYSKSADVPVIIALKYLQSTNYMNKLEQGTDN